MRRIILFFLLIIQSAVAVNGSTRYPSDQFCHTTPFQEDSLQKLQLLYRGVIWTNKYRRYSGDQFFLNPMFLPGSVSINGHTYKNLRLKYDIYSDEILTPLNMEEIIQLNKEMIDSFSLTFEKRIYRFINIPIDSASGLSGYCNLLYKGKSALYVKYVKEASTSVTAETDGEFNQSLRIFVESGEVIWPVKNSKDLSGIFKEDMEEVKNYISEKRLKVSKNDPDSFIPVIKYYDSINH
jgi:hypothetical protein